jgi:phosphatidylserine/phosphatidylglycerophosphate/cardiolipin synthase-like enzyme/uncharacterized membrane protein YdjX (TVP38/TMEM64 family)
MPLDDTQPAMFDCMARILQPGRNCWRLEKAHRFAMLVDGDAYFRAVRHAIREARHSIFILSWDIDSRMHLIPEGADDGLPDALGDFLHAVVAARPHLRAYVLNWDFAMLYALEREWLPTYKLGWRTHRRLSFRMDGQHPAGASHHQKIVVIDDALAFVGGLDLTRCRWDTPGHAGDQPLRRDAAGKPYGPFHDVQAMVDGDAARALGELCRMRWLHATGDHAAMLAPDGRDHTHGGTHNLWPQEVVPDLNEVDVGIARTAPAFEDRPGIYEVRQLHLDIIARARRRLFFENQYFTSDLIAGALAERLLDPYGPEVAVISPFSQSGWLEDATMGVLRARVHARLKAADNYYRYRMYCPHLPGLGDGCLNVHSKVFAMDDDVFSIGSANLSNRSMAFDTECNLAIEAFGSPEQRERVRTAIAAMRARLLAEHLAVSPQDMAAAARRRISLHDAIDELTHEGRTLRVLDPVVAPELDALIPDLAPFDPEKPMQPDELVAQFMPPEAHKPVSRRLLALGALTVGLGLLALAWHSTPLKDSLNLASLIEFVHGLDRLPLTPIAVLAGYAIGGLVLPITLLIAATGIVFGPVAGSIYGIAGSLLSAAVGYGLGHSLGHDAVRRLLGPRINHLSKRLARRGMLTMLVVRVLPVAPFAVINVVAGASHLRFRDFMLGTLCGMLPGIVITVTFVHNLVEAIHRPSLGTAAALAAVALLLFGGGLALQRSLANKSRTVS